MLDYSRQNSYLYASYRSNVIDKDATTIVCVRINRVIRGKCVQSKYVRVVEIVFREMNERWNAATYYTSSTSELEQITAASYI